MALYLIVFYGNFAALRLFLAYKNYVRPQRMLWRR